SPPVALTSPDTWVDVRISDGNPTSLILPPDEYWLAWQVDASTRAASASAGNAGDGLSLSWPHGPFPNSLVPGTATGWAENSGRWSVYVTFDDAPTATPTDTFTSTPTPTSTQTSTSTPTPTETQSGDTPTFTPTLTSTPIGTYFDVRPDPTDGFIDARDLIEWVSRTRGSDGAADLLFEFSVYWQRAYPPLKESGKEVE
ncbi:MAG: hypothetical protein KC978_22010, partial [Candidatus Omnitrophica bacterium]|nr:hypothetical protein [Candidatus Omnitrophota bacterium]